MATTPRAARPAPARKRGARWAALLTASAMLHLLVFGWAQGQLGVPAPEMRSPVQVALLAPPPPPPPPAPTAVPPPRAAKPRTAKVATAPVKRATPAPAIADAALPLSTQDDGNAAAATPLPADDTPPLAELMRDAMPDRQIEDALPQLKWLAVDPPPSAELRYDVHAVKGEQQWYGSGVFRWESDGSQYRLTGEASASMLLFKITVLNFSSEGVINEYGVAPVLYSEKPWRKSMTNTHFQHAQQRISFSASTASYPYMGGEQDRGSVIWQLAAIGRGTPERVQAGAEIDLMVAGARDASPWRVTVLGEENIETAFGNMKAWHLARTRRSDHHEQRLDIWLAPAQHWYPVRLRHTYANGDHLELSLASVTPLAPAPQTPGAAGVAAATTRMEHE